MRTNACQPPPQRGTSEKGIDVHGKALPKAAHLDVSDWWPRIYLGESNAIDLNVDALGKLSHSDTAAGGLVSEPLRILLVHALLFWGSGERCGSASHRGYRQEHELPRPRTAKLAMSARKTWTFTTFSMDEPASSSTALRLAMHWAVFCWTEPSIRLPSASAGIWPEQ